MDFRCCWCGARLRIRARVDARFCSGRCRVAAHRSPAPREMVAADRWVRRSARKVPLTVTGKAASSTKAATWSSFRAAKASPVGVGLGFVLNGDGIVCLDLDHCLAGGVPTSAAAGFLASLPGTFIEVSPSGDGLHIFGRGQLEHGRKLSRDGLNIEVYGSGRYIAMTGERFRAAPSRLADLSDVLASIL